MNELYARAILFSAIEGGQSFWSSEISTKGAVAVYEKLLDGGYDSIKYEKLITSLRGINGDQVLSEIDKHQARLITPIDDDWPVQVNDLAAPPIGLIVKGNIRALHQRSLAIVGTRNPTSYGARIAGDFAAGFADREWAIVSGGAYGIDSYAHKGALIAEGVTVAVIASGIDINYPAGNTRLFAEICESGVMVTESMPGQRALPHRFLTRNR